MLYRLALPWRRSAVCMHDDTGRVQRAEVSRVWLSIFFDSLGRSNFLRSTISEPRIFEVTISPGFLWRGLPIYGANCGISTHMFHVQ